MAYFLLNEPSLISVNCNQVNAVLNKKDLSSLSKPDLDNTFVHVCVVA